MVGDEVVNKVVESLIGVFDHLKLLGFQYDRFDFLHFGGRSLETAGFRVGPDVLNGPHGDFRIAGFGVLVVLSAMRVVRFVDTEPAGRDFFLRVTVTLFCRI